VGARSRLLLLLPSATYRTTAFVEAARRLHADLVVATDHANVFAEAQPDRIVTLDFAHPDVAVRQAQAFAARHPIAAVAGVDDDTAVLAAMVAAALGLPHNPVEAAMAARDKHRQRTRLAAAGVPVPAFRLRRLDEDPRTAARQTAYPCVLKPLCLSASRGVIRADGPDAFEEAHRRLSAILAGAGTGAGGERAGGYLVEAFVPGREVALEGLLDGGRLEVLALFDKPDPLDGPFFEETVYLTPSCLGAEAQRAVAACAARAALALGLAGGPVHAELRVNSAGVWLIELAARPIGGRCSRVLRFGEGRDAQSLEEVILRQALGVSGPRPAREAAPVGVMMIPVPGAGILREVRGVDAARRVPGIEGVEITAHPGQRLVPWPEGSQYPGFIFARAGSPAAAEAALREAHRALRFVIEPE
jgi:biotin carboxylase